MPESKALGIYKIIKKNTETSCILIDDNERNCSDLQKVGVKTFEIKGGGGIKEDDIIAIERYIDEHIMSLYKSLK